MHHYQYCSDSRPSVQWPREGAAFSEEAAIISILGHVETQTIRIEKNWTSDSTKNDFFLGGTSVVCRVSNNRIFSANSCVFLVVVRNTETSRIK